VPPLPKSCALPDGTVDRAGKRCTERRPRSGEMLGGTGGRAQDTDRVARGAGAGNAELGERLALRFGHSGDRVDERGIAEAQRDGRDDVDRADAGLIGSVGRAVVVGRPGGWARPTVAQAVASLSVECSYAVTSAAVRNPTPSPASPRPEASVSRCLARSVLGNSIGTWALSTHCRLPIPPPWGADEIASAGARSRHASTAVPSAARQTDGSSEKKVPVTTTRRDGPRR
jgi:hypothetical protein